MVDAEKGIVPAAEAESAATKQPWLAFHSWSRSWMPSPVVTLVASIYMVLNLGLNYYNAFLLGSHSGQVHLPLPLFYTFIHQIAACLAIGLWCLVSPAERFDVWTLFSLYWRWLLPVSAIYAASIATNNASLASISLTVNIIFKSNVPLPTMFCSYLIEGKSYSFRKIAIVSLIVAGTLFAIPWGKDQNKHTDWSGYILVILSLVASAIRPVVSAYLMNGGKDGGKSAKPALNAASMAFFDAALAAVFLLPVSLAMEAHRFPVAFAPDVATRNVLYILGGAAMAGLYGPIVFYTIRLTSSVSFVILGNFKQLILLVGAALFVDHVAAPTLWVGVAIVAVAALAYSYESHREKQQKEKEAAESTTTRGPNESTPLSSSSK